MGTRWWARNQISAVCWKRIICTWIWSVGTVIANAAYGDGRTRQQFAAAGRTLIAKVPKRPARTHFAKEDFQIDLAAGTCTCPAGQMTRSVRRRGSYVTAAAERVRPGARFTLTRRSVRPVRSAPAVWPRDRAASQSAPAGNLFAGRTHAPAEWAFAPYRHLRQAVEHRLAQLVQLGLRQARYFGRRKTAAQLYPPATVANLTRILATI